MRIIICFALAAFLLGCNNGAGLRGIYSTNDGSNDSLEFLPFSKVIVNLDGERSLGNFKITDKTISINFRNSPKLIVLTLADNGTIVKRQHDIQVFTNTDYAD